MFQDIANYPTIGAYTGLGNPFYSQHAGFQGALNPFTPAPVTGQQGYAGGVPGYAAVHPQHLQLAALVAAQQGLPHLAALTQLQNPIAGGILHNAAVAQNPLVAHLYAQHLHAQQLQPQVPVGVTGHQMSPYAAQPGHPWAQQTATPYAPVGLPWAQQAANPYTPTGNPYAAPHAGPWAQPGLPLAPQTWVGAGQIGQQIHPLLAQLAARQFAAPGISGFGLGY